MEISDKLLSFHEKLVDFFDKNLRLILLLIFFLFFLGFLWGGISYYFSKKEKEAALKLLEASQTSDMSASLNQIIKNYKGTSAALQASLLLWSHYFQQKNFSKMQELLKSLKKDYPDKLEAVILYGEAKLLENQKKWKKALEIYKKISKKETDLNFLVYPDIARLSEKLGDKKLAVEYYKKSLQSADIEETGWIEFKLSQLTK
jgi:predicted negative regulator of RcsB-dependent stress response